MIEKELMDAGLDDKETKVYLAALELGETNISRLAQKSKIKRTTVYLAIETLKEKGLISAVKKGKKTFFYAESPKVLEERLEEKKAALQKVMPELLSFTNLIDKKPTIRYFEGKEGIREVYRDTLKYPDSEILSCFSDEYKFFSENFYYDYYMPARTEKKIWVRALLPDTEQMKKMQSEDQKYLRKSKLIDQKIFNINVEFNIYGKNKVAIISYEEEIALLIESPKIFQSIKSMFETIWTLAPEK